MARRALIPLLALAALASAGCGSQGINLDSGENATVKRGAVLFQDRCSGCHTLEAAGTQGSAVNAGDKEHTDGPNFDDRREDVNGVLYAIRNGGFSGAIMPENIATGEDADAIAQFLAKYAGRNIPGRNSISEAGDTGEG
jgi:mono/diheme cytochrome c family protein